MIISHAKKFAFFRVPKTGSTTAEFMLRIGDGFDDAEIIATRGFGKLDNLNLPSDLEDRLATPEEARDMSLANKASGRPSFPESIPDTGLIPAPNAVHMTPTEAIGAGLITIEQLREYSCYAYLRDPYERYLSAFNFTIGRVGGMPDIFRDIVSRDVGMGLAARPQKDYFFVDGEQVVEPLDFSRYTEELKRVIAASGGYPFKNIPKLNTRSGRLQGLTSNDYYDQPTRQRVAVKCQEDIQFYQSNRMAWDS